MSLIVEDGTGVVGAEAYAAVTVIDAYWLARAHDPNAAIWAAATTPFKEGAAREATDFLDANYGPYYRGVRRGYVQGRLFPRSEALDDAGYPLPDLPADLVAATCELSGRAVAARLAPDASSDAVIKRFRETIGPLTEEIEYADGAVAAARYGFVAGMISAILNGTQPGAPGGQWNWR